MVKWLCTILLLGLGCRAAFAHHIIGGQMYYTDAGGNAGTHSWEIHLRLYRGCEQVDNQHAPLDDTIYLSIFDRGSQAYLGSVMVLKSQTEKLSAAHIDPCIVNPPEVCYLEGFYDTRITLPVNNMGYTVTYQRCCRDNLLVNVQAADVGATYTTDLPGLQSGVLGDNSPVFLKEEAVLICANAYFSYDYAATDPDAQDVLRYSFVPALDGASANNVAPKQSDPPPYYSLTYIAPYSANDPMGDSIHINPETGLIYGRAPAAGTYVVTVAAYEYRKGLLIGKTVKDFQFKVNDCQREAVADIPPDFRDCKSLTVQFANQSHGTAYLWQFGDGSSSSQYAPSHTYSSPGLYQVKLNVNPGSSCGDSATSQVRVYPVLATRFASQGVCQQFPVQFRDQSTTTLGMINSWHWDFGDPAGGSDTADVPDPPYSFSQPGSFQVRLQVGTSLGCLQLDTQTVRVLAPPRLQVTSDTALCYGDAVRLWSWAASEGTYNWSPAYRLQGAAQPDPLVQPLVDTSYRLVFTDQNGCQNSDSVHLHLVHQLHIRTPSDTVICSGDPLSLQGRSDGPYSYTWTDSLGRVLSRSLDTDLLATYSGTYFLHAYLESCHAEDSMKAALVPYPEARVSPDTSICYGDSIQLREAGSPFIRWSPEVAIRQVLDRNPWVRPLQTQVYTLTALDTMGCPKPSLRKVQVTVIPPIIARAGPDTLLAFGQSVRLHGSGAPYYSWSPALGLSDPYIADPLASPQRDMWYYLKTFTSNGCYGVDSVQVRYAKGPALYVPNAFSPNGDGINDVFRPVPVGIRRFHFFRVFDRWGRLVFSSRDPNAGWNGYVRGVPADLGTYVWEVEGTDLNGRLQDEKGSVVLLR